MPYIIHIDFIDCPVVQGIKNDYRLMYLVLGPENLDEDTFSKKFI